MRDMARKGVWFVQKCALTNPKFLTEPCPSQSQPCILRNESNTQYYVECRFRVLVFSNLFSVIRFKNNFSCFLIEFGLKRRDIRSDHFVVKNGPLWLNEICTTFV